MARKQSTGQIRVWLCLTIANPAQPSVAEITAGVDLTPNMRRDGLKTPKAANFVDGSDASSAQDKQSRGTFGAGPVTYVGYRDDTTGGDTAYTALADATVGYLVIRRFGGSTLAPATTQKVEVWPVEVGTREMADIGDENQRFTAMMAVPGAIFESAVIT